MKQFCEHAIFILAYSRGKVWADEFVRLRMDFHRQHGRGLILSTWHGLDFFDNVLNCLNGGECDEPKGEYRNNFLKLITIGMNDA
jgi:hypothetical protein